MTAYSQVLTEICDQTYKMLEMAQCKQWPELIEAESSRRELLQKLEMYNPASETEPDLENKLQEIIDINNLIAKLSDQERGNQLDDFKQIKNSKKATEAYSKF